MKSLRDDDRAWFKKQFGLILKSGIERHLTATDVYLGLMLMAGVALGHAIKKREGVAVKDGMAELEAGVESVGP